jgi:hypothetical protein
VSQLDPEAQAPVFQGKVFMPSTSSIRQSLSIGDEELPESMVRAREVGGGEAYYSIVGLLERGRIDEGEFSPPN